MASKGTINDNELFRNARSIVIFGNIGSGKTSLAFRILEMTDKKVFFIAHPKPNLIKGFGYENLESVEDLEVMQDCIVVWDEPQLSLNMSDYKRDRALARALSLARQRGVTMIVITSDSRLLSPRVESYLEIWCIKNCDYNMTKQRSKIRNIIQKNCLIAPEGFKLQQEEFLLETLDFEKNGRYKFEMIGKWSDELSKSYRLDETPKNLVENLKTEETEINLNHSTGKKLPIFEITKDEDNERG